MPEEEEKEEKGLQTHLVPKEMEARGVDERVRRACFYSAPASPQVHSHLAVVTVGSNGDEGSSGDEGSNFPTDSPPEQNILPNGRGCVLVSVNAAITFPHF